MRGALEYDAFVSIIQILHWMDSGAIAIDNNTPSELRATYSPSSSLNYEFLFSQPQRAVRETQMDAERSSALHIPSHEGCFFQLQKTSDEHIRQFYVGAVRAAVVGHTLCGGQCSVLRNGPLVRHSLREQHVALMNRVVD